MTRRWPCIMVTMLCCLLAGCDASGQAWILWTRQGSVPTARDVLRFGSWTKQSAHSTRADCIRRFPAPRDFHTETGWARTSENKQSVAIINKDGSAIQSEYACWPAGVNPEP
jgi:hypothetical protein